MAQHDHAHAAVAAMLIRRPVAEVFEAFIDPAVTTRIWFTKSSGRLEPGKALTWTWEMYNHTASVKVLEVVAPERILIEWGNYEDKTLVEWTFRSLSPDATFVRIVNSGFKGDAEQLLSQVRDSTEGFTLVLAGLKALLEQDIELNLVADRFPPGL